MKPIQRSEPSPDDVLRRRAKAFVSRAVPAELRPRYVAGSIADILIASCAQGEAVDPDLLEMAELAAQEYPAAIAKARTAELKDYYQECQTILAAIIAGYNSSR